MVANTKPPPPLLDTSGLGADPRPAYTTDMAIAVCERCGHGWGVERSLWGLATAETDHALTCGGSMYLTEDGKKRLDAVAPNPEPPPLPPPDLDLLPVIRK